ncbi:hypothetical protein R75461_07288 [Paraburkholderia nemoris]|uniref:hypothetical protein n=1 Tax=Paraburkholderia nemoris TaxID=2793076 RepID=UPI00190ABEAD|nr:MULTISPECIES: hypothetical protein [Paraburkholderia]MBK3786059.1 hypothetical protein [Paraburkholderia aspalathi]CAE6846934.1 hypothetical protein R75461_07288 [Paraburkholderia nemoris]
MKQVRKFSQGAATVSSIALVLALSFVSGAARAQGIPMDGYDPPALQQLAQQVKALQQQGGTAIGPDTQLQVPADGQLPQPPPASPGTQPQQANQ